MLRPDELVSIAVDAMDTAYAPYSHFRVGAALLCADGTVYSGCNIENAAYSPSVCAERVALFSAVRDGHRAFAALAVVGGAGGVLSSYTTPCGVCRQVLAEFCRADMPIYLYNGNEIRETSFGALFPVAFGPADLDPTKGDDDHAHG